MTKVALFICCLAFYLFSPILNSTFADTVTHLNNNWFLLGFNYPWFQYNYDFGGSQYSNINYYQTTIDSQLKDISLNGTHVTRWYIFNNTAKYPTFNSQTGLVEPLPLSFYQNFDSLIVLAKKNNIYLIPQLIDTTLTLKTNPASSPMTILTDQTVRQSYLDSVVKPLLERYGNEPQIIAWSIINEPEWSTQGTHPDSNYNQVTLSQMQDFIRQNANYIHSYSTQKATMESGGTPWVQNWKNLGLDLYFVHWYDWIDNEPNGISLSPYNLKAADLGLDKPVIISEFPTKSTKYTLTQSLEAFYNNGYAGALAWCYEANNPDQFCNYSGNKSLIKTFETSHLAEVNINSLSEPSTIPLPSASPNTSPSPSASPSLSPSPSPTPTIEPALSFTKNGIDYINKGGPRCWTILGTSLINCEANSYANYNFNLTRSTQSATLALETSNYSEDMTLYIPNHNVEIYLDGIKVGTIQNPTTSFNNHQFGFLTLGPLKKGKHTLKWLWTNDFYQGDTLDSNIAVHKLLLSY
jgi:hypothetical protein